MAVPSTIKKGFQDWKGLHKGYSDFNRPEGFADVAQNVMIDENFDLITIPGFKVVHGPAVSSSDDFRGLFTYVYYDSTTGSTTQELIAIGLRATPVVFKFTTGSLTVTYTGGATSVITFKVNSSNLWEVDIQENGVSVTGYPKTYGTGIGAGLTTTELRDLQADIDALASYVASITTSTDAGTSFIQAGVLEIIGGTTLVSTVASTFSYPYTTAVKWAGDKFSYPYSNVSKHPDFTNPSAANLNNILYIAPFGDFLYKYDSQNLYRAGVIKPSIDTKESGPGFMAGPGSLLGLTGVYTGHYTYIKKDKRGQIFEGPPSEDSSVTVTNSGIVYTPRMMWTGNGPTVGPDSNQTTVNTITLDPATFDPNINIGDYAVFYDSVSGVSVQREITAVNKTAASPSITISGSAVTVNNATIIHIARDEVFKFDLKGGQISSSTVGAASNNIPLTSGHTLEVGDVAYFWNETEDAFIERNITAKTATQITVDGSAVEVSTGATSPIGYVSNNNRIGIYRTKAGGNIKYLVAELPAAFYGTTGSGYYSWDNNLADSQLGAQYLPPVRQSDPPPKTKFVIPHQGLLVCAGDPDAPNTIYFSEPNNVEAFPLATNSVDIPFVSQGPITGLAIESGVLVVFKDVARAFVQGDLAADSFSVQVIEDGIGCPGHASIAQTPVGLIWLSKRGFQRQSQGQLDPEFNARTAIDFKNQEYVQTVDGTISTTNGDESRFVVKRAAAINDYRLQRYLCTVPCESGICGADGSNNKRANSNTKTYCFDYKNNVWSLWGEGAFTHDSTTNKWNAYGGWAIYQGDLYFAACIAEDGGPTRAGNIMREHRRTDLYQYAFNTAAIDSKVTTEWVHGGEPTVFKMFKRLKMRISDPSLLPAASTYEVNTYRDFQSSVHSTFTKAFTTSTKERVAKLIGGKSQALKIEFRSNTLHQALRLSGYELEIATPYNVEVKE